MLFFLPSSLALVDFLNLPAHYGSERPLRQSNLQMMLAAPTPTNIYDESSIVPSPRNIASNSEISFDSSTLQFSSADLPGTTVPFLLMPPPQKPFETPCINSTSDGSACPSRMLVMAYYPDWVGSSFPPSRIDFKRVDWIDFAFAVPAEDFSLTWDDPTGPTLLENLVSSAHSMGAKVKLSIGGWTGSK